MPYGYTTDPELDQSTNRFMIAGAVLLLAMAAAFPLYLTYEPSSRDDARAEQLSSLAEEGANIWAFNCASCHGDNGEGTTAPALNSDQFLQSATNEQIQLLVSVGIPGSAMGAYSQDFAGPLTSEQIKAVTTYLRSLEEDAPDLPNWRNPLDFSGLIGEELYAEACSGCHGADRKGMNDSGPDISLTSETLQESDGFLIGRITNGRKDMPQFGQALTSEQIDSLISFLRSGQ